MKQRKTAISLYYKDSKGKKTKKYLYAVWEEVFIDNEERKKKLTDVQLSEKMLKFFPEKAGKTTITRVSMVRHNYNKGSGLFANCSAAEDEGNTKPKSFGYDEKGNVVKAGRKAGTTLTAGGKVVMKSAVTEVPKICKASKKAETGKMPKTLVRAPKKKAAKATKKKAVKPAPAPAPSKKTVAKKKKTGKKSK